MVTDIATKNLEKRYLLKRLKKEVTLWGSSCELADIRTRRLSKVGPPKNGSVHLQAGTVQEPGEVAIESAEQPNHMVYTKNMLGDVERNLSYYVLAR